MGLRTLVFPEARVEIPGGGAFTVRGISPDMVVSLYNRHRGELAILFDSIAASAGGEAPPDISAAAWSLLGASPVIMAEIIALASGSHPAMEAVDPDVEVNPFGQTDWERDVEAARKLSGAVQIDALIKIAEMTFSSDMPAGKFLAVVIQMAGATTAALAKPKA